MICIPGTDVMGARLAIYPMQDDFATVILAAVRETDGGGLMLSTDDLSTCVQGPPDRVFAYVKEVFVRAAAAGGHVVANLLLSAG